MFILTKPLRGQLSPIAVLSKLVDSCRGGRELKPKPQMVQYASHLAIAFSTGCFTGNDFRQLRVMTALSHNRGFQESMERAGLSSTSVMTPAIKGNTAIELSAIGNP
jgi:hypothetical protein